MDQYPVPSVPRCGESRSCGAMGVGQIAENNSGKVNVITPTTDSGRNTKPQTSLEMATTALEDLAAQKRTRQSQEHQKL